MNVRYESKDISALFEIVQLENEVFDAATQPPVDMLPVLKYVPARWAPWKSLMKQIRSLHRTLFFDLLKECENRVAQGGESEQEAFIDMVVRRQMEFGLDREMTA